jgi:hypothetical protein
LVLNWAGTNSQNKKPRGNGMMEIQKIGKVLQKSNHQGLVWMVG